jgi:hypothetical protein
MTGEPFSVTLFDGTPTGYLSYVTAGLYELRAQGRARLIYARSRRWPRRPLPNAQMWLILARGEQSLRVFMDLIDAPDIDEPSLAAADVYIKRSFDPARLACRPAAEQARIMPLGIHFPCTSRHESLRDRISAALAVPAEPVRPGRLTGRTVIALSRGWAAERYLRARPLFLDELIRHPDQPAEPIVYFRTRLIDPDSAANPGVREAIEALNAGRVTLIRTLKRRLGPLFAGGLYPTPTTIREQPDLIYNLPDGLAGQRGHIAMSQRCLIAINTAGVHRSTGWKFPESLAASKCLVSEPPVYRNLCQAQAGVHYLPFTTPSECADACEGLLAEPARAAALRESAFRFFLREVEPGSAIGRALAHAWRAGQPFAPRSSVTEPIAAAIPNSG